MTVGNRIQEIRKVRGYSQEAVAQDLGISKTAYARIERNEVDISLTRLEQIAKVLKVDARAFLSPESSIVIIGDNSINGGYHGTYHQKSDFEKERKAYQEHITSLKNQIKEMQKIIDNFLARLYYFLYFRL